MTDDRSQMRDGDMPLLDRIDVALRRVTNGEGQMRVPVEATDPDVVLFDCRAEIGRLHRRVAALELAATRAERKLAAYVGVCNGDKELTNVVLPMLRTAMRKEGGE